MAMISRAWRGARTEWKLHALSCVSLSVAFMCLATALLVVFNINAVRHRWSQAGRISVYLHDGVSAEAIMKLRTALDQSAGVTSVRYVSPQDAQAKLVKASGDSLVQALPTQSFPASLEIDLSGDVTAAQLADMTSSLAKLPTVESVETYDRYTRKLQRITWAAVIASVITAVLVFVVVSFVVGSTVRMSLQRRAAEVEVLRLVGASNRYVSGPFIVEGGIIGIAGAVSAIAMLGLLYTAARADLASMTVLAFGVQPQFLPWYGTAGAILTGGLLGAAASYAGLRRMITV